jgi:hypothetical protein
MRKLFLLMFVMFILVGCAPTWTHPNPMKNNDNEFRRDSDACRFEARIDQFFNSSRSSYSTFQNSYKKCMQTKGWVAK